MTVIRQPASPFPAAQAPTVAGPGVPGLELLAAGFLLGYADRTRQAYARDLRDFDAWCRSHDLDLLRVGRGHLNAYVAQLRQRGLSPATVSRRLSALAGFYRYAEGEGAIPRSPATHMRRPRVADQSQSTGLDRDELTRLIDAARQDGARAHALVLLLGLNGLRVSEVVTAAVEDLSQERGHRVLRVTRKGGARATVPLAPTTGEALDAYLQGRATGPLFVTRTGRALDRVAVWRLVRRLAATAVPAKASSLHPHDLRHAFVTLALDSGASLRDVQDAAGHADPRTTRRYDRARHNLDRHPTYGLAGLLGGELTDDAGNGRSDVPGGSPSTAPRR